MGLYSVLGTEESIRGRSNWIGRLQQKTKDSVLDFSPQEKFYESAVMHSPSPIGINVARPADGSRKPTNGPTVLCRRFPPFIPVSGRGREPAKHFTVASLFLSLGNTRQTGI
jgi:hypothetical protein